MKPNLRWIGALAASVVFAACSPEAAVKHQASGPIPVYPIGGFAPRPERDKADGFTLAGPVYSNPEKTLAECEKLGLSFMYPVGVPLDFLGKKGEPPKELDVDAIRASIKSQVEAVMQSATITAWYLTPEELRHWGELEMEYLRIATETINETDPQKRPIWMYEPCHRTAGSLEKTSPYLGIVGKGMYVNYAGRKQERAWLRWSHEEQTAAIRAVKPDALSYAILEMFQEPAESEQEAIHSWVRHDSYISLMQGAKGIVVFSFGRRPKFPSYDRYYDAYRQVASELNGKTHLGAIFLEGAQQPDPTFEVVAGNPTTQLSGSKSNPKDPLDLPSVIAQHWEWRGNRYLFVVNSSAETVSVRFPKKKWEPVLQDQPVFDGAVLKLPAWGVSVFKR